MRQFDVYKVSKAIKYIRQTDNDFDYIEWISNPLNICLENNIGDLVLFEYVSPGVVTGHYYFKSRGKQAIQSALNFLDEIFSPCYNIHVIKGITALDHLGARWLSKHIGFKSYGVVHAQGRAAELFILTKEEYLNK